MTNRNTKPPYPAYRDRPDKVGTRPHAIHKHNPAGSKMVRGFYRAKFGLKKSYMESLEWYRLLK